MHVHRGRGESLDADREATADLVERTARTGRPGLRVWRPPPHVAFGRRDATSDGYDRARAAAEELGYPPIERDVGGRAVAFTDGTVAFVLAEPVDRDQRGISERYERVLATLENVLEDLGVVVRRGEPEGAFCPGTHSLQADGKVAGLAQRVRGDVASVGGFIVVADAEAIAGVLDPVYEALDVPFSEDALGSVGAAGGPADTDSVARAVEQALVGERSVDLDNVRET